MPQRPEQLLHHKIDSLSGKMIINPNEIKMLRESAANLEYLIQKISDPELKKSFAEQLEHCKARLLEIETPDKADGHAAN